MGDAGQDAKGYLLDGEVIPRLIIHILDIKKKPEKTCSVRILCSNGTLSVHKNVCTVTKKKYSVVIT